MALAMTKNLDQLLDREEELEEALVETGPAQRMSRGQKDGRDQAPPEVQEVVVLQELGEEETEELEAIEELEGDPRMLIEAERA